jgi:ketosteroid isomerase-like protein
MADHLTYQAPTPEQLAQAEDWVRRFAARWENPNPDNLRDLMHPDTQNLIPPMKTPGDGEAVVAHFKGVVATLPGFSLRVLRWGAVADTVMVEWEGSATIAGEVIHWRGIDRISLRDGKTYEGQVYWDTRDLYERVTAAVTAAQARAAGQSAAA